jgi:hypothetical protein
MTDEKNTPSRESLRHDATATEKDRETLKEKAKEGLKDAKGRLPGDEV